MFDRRGADVEAERVEPYNEGAGGSMVRLALRLAVLAATLVFTIGHLSAQSSKPGPLEGKWVLAEQSYGKGTSNLAKRAPGLHLQIGVGLGTPDVTVWSEGEPPQPWPSMTVDKAVAPSEILERTVDVDGGHLSARYRVSPPAEDGLTLDISEIYSLSAGGDALNGTYTVHLSRDGEPRGSFVLHRRFVRAPR
jgi:hypothetical protein